MQVICDYCGEKTLYENGRCMNCGWILDMNENIAEYVEGDEEVQNRLIGVAYDDNI